MKILLFGLALLSWIVISGCADPPEPEEGLREISAEDFARHVKVLASDEFEGRAPGSRGEELTVEYLTGEFRELGLEPGNGDSYEQSVPLTSITAEEVSPLTISDGERTIELRYQEDMMASTRRFTERTGLDASELVFVGYGIVAPEYEWNDYAGVDVTGKTVVVLVNDPGFATEDPDLFNGRAMTYYGRWTYKYEEAARQGADGALIIHETEAAGYPWLVVSAGWSGENFDLVRGEEAPRRLPIEGWITSGGAQELFALAGKDLEDLAARAAKRDFRPAELDLKATVSVRNALDRETSSNVIALLPGTARPDEYIVYSAHWDHLGVARSVLQDRIYNGAADNASGVAALLEIAESFTLLKPERSIVFLTVTAEESGLLGSDWYANHPVYPLERTVANINIDRMTLLGPTNDVTVIGYGNSELDEWAARVAASQGRRLEPEPTPEKGFFYRSDHFNFAKRGVPALYVRGGVEHREKGAEYGLAYDRAWIQEKYHKVTDEYDPEWDLRGVVEDIRLLFGTGLALANSEEWPNWSPGNEFRATRDASAAERSP